MGGSILYFIHYGLLLVFGLLLSVGFAGIRGNLRKNGPVFGAVFVVCGLGQLAAYRLLDEAWVWKLYPLIVHAPIVAVLWLYYRRRPVTALSAVAAAYLFCQPANWAGLLCAMLTDSAAAQQAVRIGVLLIVGGFALYYVAPCLADIFQKETGSVWIFGSIPMVYYLFDYTAGVYTDLWIANNRVIAEFMPFFLCVVFVSFIMVYYRQHEKRADAQRREHIIRITAQQQAREVEAFRRSDREVGILRHDMRLFLSSLAVCLEDGNIQKARQMIAAYCTHIDGTKVKRFCENDTVNFILSDFAAKCAAEKVEFLCTVEAAVQTRDEILFSSILSNALDNALNAQSLVAEDRRQVKLMLKQVDGHLLLSVKNPVGKIPAFVDGLPVAQREGHGYGTQSIRYMTERLGGKCQFLVERDMFILRVVL